MARPWVQIVGLTKTCELFQMVEAEVRFDNAHFHLSGVGEENYHNAYEADENHTLFRADAVWTYESESDEYTVPVYAMQMNRDKGWRWCFRFRPIHAGTWHVRIRVLCWHKDPVGKELDRDHRVSKRDGKTYYEHEFGYKYKDEDYKTCPGAARDLEVRGGKRLGPLETPDPRRRDNPHYFYRGQEVDGTYQRRPYFLIGMARPWNVDDPGWHNFLRWDADLFDLMKKYGCNLLYHWMAPWESQLVHQAEKEAWPDARNQLQPPFSKGKFRSTKERQAYKRYDQGRALFMDRILAKSQDHQILTLLSVLTHQSLQGATHKWGENGWDNLAQPPSQLNGFHLFPRSAEGLALEDFFRMSPDNEAEPWQRKLWKHFANFWRYVLARWTSCEALAGWVLIDELEGVGPFVDFWWWRNKAITGPWHNNLLKMLRGRLPWKEEDRTLPYTGDYLRHPLTVSTTYYPYPNQEKDLRTASRAEVEEYELQKMDQQREWQNCGSWNGTPTSWSKEPEQLDFLSNHAYQQVPVWNEGKTELRWTLSNGRAQTDVKADRWFWDALCMRLQQWSQVGEGGSPIPEPTRRPEDWPTVTLDPKHFTKFGPPIPKPRLVTEYGSRERDGPEQSWDHYGKRSPSLTHFANWSGLMLGYAGVPLKWNDGKELGDMIGRPSSDPWNPGGRYPRYPVNCYAEMTSIAEFLKGVPKEVPLDSLYPQAYRIMTKRGTEPGSPNWDYHVWALADTKDKRCFLVWICDRTFQQRKQPDHCLLEIEGALPNAIYTYTRFNTWDAVWLPPLRKGLDTVTANNKGVLSLELPAFPRAEKRSDTVSSADRNDIALRLFLKGER